jgi:hypothetical protein
LLLLVLLLLFVQLILDSFHLLHLLQYHCLFVLFVLLCFIALVPNPAVKPDSNALEPEPPVCAYVAKPAPNLLQVLMIYLLNYTCSS